MTSFDLAAIFIGLVALIGWLNARWLRLPTGVAMLLVGLVGASLAQTAEHTPLAAPAFHYLSHLVARVNFSQTVVGYMLAFLLFAGAMQVDLAQLRRQRLSVLTLATLGVFASTLIVGFGVYGAAQLLGLPLSLPWALVFGALISPTDPVAVLAAVHKGGLPASLQAVLQGEALFNDGVGIVMFAAMVDFAIGGPTPHAGPILRSVAAEAAGGLALGLAAGWLGVRAMRAIDDYVAEVSLTLALAAGTYAGAHALHLSAPIAAVAAGLLVGDHDVGKFMSETTRRYVTAFWTLVDEILNALLFLLLGLEIIVLPFDLKHAGLWMAAIPLVVLARLAVVLPWGAYFHFRQAERGASLILAWGGLRGGLSLALALDAPAGPQRELLLALTYAVVVFSVVIQGLSFPALVSRLCRQSPSAQDRAAVDQPG
jgi:CPA1 family monovalent cation:H+ antiporter